MNESWNEYCKNVVKATGQNMEQVSSSIKLFMQSASYNNMVDAFRALSGANTDELVEVEEDMTGNKRNGTQDRRQAFGSLF